MKYAKASDNPFLDPEYVKDMSAGGYGFPSWEEYKRRYPKTRRTPAQYYCEVGAYELAAKTDPIYAWGAQLARRALVNNRITPKEYQRIKKQGFADSEGNPLAPIGRE